METEHYKGKIKIKTAFDSRGFFRYKLVGERTYLISVTSVTGLLDKSKALLPAALKIVNSTMYRLLSDAKSKQFGKEEILLMVDEALRSYEVEWEEKKQIGIEAHKWFEHFAKSKLEKKLIDDSVLQDLRPEVEKVVGGFLDWYNQYKTFKFLFAEKVVYSKKHKYVGVLDAGIQIGRKKRIIDYKIADRIYSDRYYQLSGYWHAYEEEHGETFDEGMFPMFNRETGEMTPVIMTREQYEKNLPAFLGLLQTKRREKELAREYYAARKD